MVGLLAPKAEGVAALAHDGRDDDVERACGDVALDGVLAVGGGAPDEVAVVVDVGSVEEGAISETAKKGARGVRLGRGDGGARGGEEAYRANVSGETRISTVFSSTITLHLLPMH